MESTPQFIDGFNLAPVVLTPEASPRQITKSPNCARLSAFLSGSRRTVGLRPWETPCLKLAPFPPGNRWAEHGSSAQVFQTSIFSAISRASSTSTPRYRTVLSTLCPAGHRSDYVPCRTMSRRSTIPFVINASGRAAQDIVHGCHRALRKASNLSSGRMPLLQCNVAIRINPLDKENYVQRAQRQRAVRSAQLATTGHSPARDIVDAPMPEQ